MSIAGDSKGQAAPNTGGDVPLVGARALQAPSEAPCSRCILRRCILGGVHLLAKHEDGTDAGQEESGDGGRPGVGATRPSAELVTSPPYMCHDEDLAYEGVLCTGERNRRRKRESRSL